MFEKIMNTFRLREKVANDDNPSRRRFTRRSCDTCVGVVNGKTYPVQDWSLGGVLLQAGAEDFGVEDEHNVILKFKLRDEMIDVPHSAQVIRKSANSVALEFRPLTKAVRDSFQNVVDDYVASQFADTQA